MRSSTASFEPTSSKGTEPRRCQMKSNTGRNNKAGRYLQEWVECCHFRTSLLRSNGEGDRSAVRLSGGGASGGFAQPVDSIRDRVGIGEHVGRGDPNYLQPK